MGNDCKWKTFLQEKATGLKWTGWILLPRKLLSGRRWQILPTLGLKLRCPSGCFWLPRFPNDLTQPIPPFQMTLLSRFRRQNQIPGGSELERSDSTDKAPHPLSLTITMQASPSQPACISLVAWLTADRSYAQRDVWSKVQERSGTSQENRTFASAPKKKPPLKVSRPNLVWQFRPAIRLLKCLLGIQIGRLWAKRQKDTPGMGWREEEQQWWQRTS